MTRLPRARRYASGSFKSGKDAHDHRRIRPTAGRLRVRRGPRRSGSGTQRFPHWGVVRGLRAVLYVVALVAYTIVYGIPVQRELVIAWTCGALAVASIGRPPREILQLLLDWAADRRRCSPSTTSPGAPPTRWASASTTTPMIDFDELRLLRRDADRVAAGRISTSRASCTGRTSPSPSSTPPTSSSPSPPPACSGRATGSPSCASSSAWSRWRSPASRPTSLFPAAPPWMAGEEGLLEGVHRTTGKGWEVIDLGTAAMFSRGQEGVNLVAAVPSLHSAFVALVAMFLWSRVRPLVRPLLAAYPLAMGLTLIATGEHYFFDVLLGWLYAGAVMAAWAWWERAAQDDSGLRSADLSESIASTGERVDAARLGQLQGDQVAEHHRREVGARCGSPPPSAPERPRRRWRRSPPRSARSGGAGAGAGRRPRASPPRAGCPRAAPAQPQISLWSASGSSEKKAWRFAFSLIWVFQRRATGAVSSAAVDHRQGAREARRRSPPPRASSSPARSSSRAAALLDLGRDPWARPRPAPRPRAAATNM